MSANPNSSPDHPNTSPLSKHRSGFGNNWDTMLKAKLILFTLLVAAKLEAFTCSSENTPSKQGRTLQGQLLLPKGGAGRLRDIQVVVTLDGGKQLIAFCQKDGSFQVPGLTPGTHTLDVVALGWFFPEIKLDVSSRGNGEIRAHYVERRKPLPYPLELRGTPISYFERRKPFSLWGFIKSPTGLMICMMLFGIIVFPMLKVDPEEYRQMKEMWNTQNQGGQGQIQGRAKND